MAAVAGVVALALVAVVVGCGGGSRSSGGMMGGGTGMPSGSPMGTPATTASPGSGQAGSDGRGLFLASGCGGCHTLAAAGASGTAGPDLDRARPSYARTLAEVTNGSGSMPAFADRLSRSQIQAIARFVADATR